VLWRAAAKVAIGLNPSLAIHPFSAAAAAADAAVADVAQPVW